MFGNAENAIPFVEHVDDILCREIIKIALGRNTFPEHDSRHNGGCDPEVPGDLGNAVTGTVHVDYRIGINMDSSTGHATLSGLDGKPLTAEVLAEFISIYAKMGGKSFEAGELVFEAVRVDEKLICENFTGHVYTFQSNDGWFGAGAENIVTQNCHCMSRSIMPELMRQH
jgi:hypothetical protein